MYKGIRKWSAGKQPGECVCRGSNEDRAMHHAGAHARERCEKVEMRFGEGDQSPKFNGSER